ncbi:nickel pincer cofactor biosynthesis protein LarC [Hornefia butyriciproducens]|uniref:nickel pincer cofactor biosynthesis protein LarC n=1 Tax=Hornefia butyriciproducens TaxID=2652293 RepID=UPI002A748951|nr:nickel pincer cofactor biosynthesis protein LarC [Hornefia butyriciproducens]MDY2991862.1 nickel pincer cofactor biosynthesis protein LarC [Hornefia butyriciproducens]
MKTLYIECNMGIAGDMLMGALAEIAPAEAVEKLRTLKIPGTEISFEHGEKCGIGGTRAHVLVHGEEEGSVGEHGHGEHDHCTGYGHGEHGHDAEHVHHHEHHHYGMEDIRSIINELPVSASVKENALAIYTRIASAESKVHGQPVSEIHFHEVGAMDAVADVVGNCFLLEAIGAERIVSSPVNVGSGSVRCAHGILPVPAPATAEILKGTEYYSDEIRGELCTPTGAAILTHFTDEIGARPRMRVDSVGIGAGTKDFPKANILRVFLGEAREISGADDGAQPEGRDFQPAADEEIFCDSSDDSQMDQICELSANIDDMTGEELGFAMERILEAGALDVYYTPIVMKKSRPAVKLSCLCRREKAKAMAEVIFRHTRTAGIRRQDFVRYVLQRESTERDGLRVKSYRGYGVERSKPEYEDLAELARSRDGSLIDMKGEKE